MGDVKGKVLEIMTAELAKREEALEGGDSFSVDAYLRAVESLEAWATYERRRESSARSQKFDAETRYEWYDLTRHVLSDHERKRERWCHYAAAACAGRPGLSSAANADIADELTRLEEERFGVPK